MLKLLKKKGSSPKSLIKTALKGFEIPSFPTVVLEALEVIRDPETSLDEIGDALLKDPGLVVTLLKTVNSAGFGLVRQVDNVSHAVSMMGRSPLESLVLALAVRESLPTPRVEEFDSTRFWTASARRATLARLIAQKLHPHSQTECFTAALLQDMAVPLIAQARPDEYAPVLREWLAASEKPLHTLEEQAFTWTHAEVGGLLAEAWGLPPALTTAIADHHATGETTVDPAVRLVGFVREDDADPGTEAVVEAACIDHGIDRDEMSAIITDNWEKAEDVVRALGGC